MFGFSLLLMVNDSESEKVIIAAGGHTLNTKPSTTLEVIIVIIILLSGKQRRHVEQLSSTCSRGAELLEVPPPRQSLIPKRGGPNPTLPKPGMLVMARAVASVF